MTTIGLPPFRECPGREFGLAASPGAGRSCVRGAGRGSVEADSAGSSPLARALIRLGLSLRTNSASSARRGAALARSPPRSLAFSLNRANQSESRSKLASARLISSPRGGILAGPDSPDPRGRPARGQGGERAEAGVEPDPEKLAKHEDLSSPGVDPQNPACTKQHRPRFGMARLGYCAIRGKRCLT
jgi:hypothetical protein